MTAAGAVVWTEQMTHANSSGQSAVRLLRVEPSHGVALAGHTLVVLWLGETSKQAVRELRTQLENHAAENGRVALLQVIGERAIPPDGEARAALAAMLKDNEARIVASAVVFEGSGFRASVIRSIVVGISMLTRPKCPHTVFASVSEGITWLSVQLGSNDAARHATDMQLAVDKLRANVR
jgi:eukaryotic-like serine/threonine-protein kinase